MGFLIFQMEHVSLLEYKIQQPRKSNMELYKGVKEKDKLIKIEWLYVFQFLVLEATWCMM